MFRGAKGKAKHAANVRRCVCVFGFDVKQKSLHREHNKRMMGAGRRVRVCVRILPITTSDKMDTTPPRYHSLPLSHRGTLATTVMGGERRPGSIPLLLPRFYFLL